jgi:hypothetical protein
MTAEKKKDAVVSDDEMVSPRERRAQLIARAEELEAENDEASEQQFQEAREFQQKQQERERFAK